MAWPKRGVGLSPAIVRSVQVCAVGSHSHVSCLGMPGRPTCDFSMPPNKTARLRVLSQTKAPPYRALGATLG